MKNVAAFLSLPTVCLVLLGAVACASDDDGGGGSGGTSGSGGSTGTSKCEAFASEVAKRKAALGCTVDNSAEAKTSCETVLSTFPACAQLWDAFVTCISSKPDTDWLCDPSNKASPKADVCKTEYDAFSACATS